VPARYCAEFAITFSEMLKEIPCDDFRKKAMKLRNVGKKSFDLFMSYIQGGNDEIRS